MFKLESPEASSLYLMSSSQRLMTLASTVLPQLLMLGILMTGYGSWEFFRQQDAIYRQQETLYAAVNFNRIFAQTAGQNVSTQLKNINKQIDVLKQASQNIKTSVAHIPPGTPNEQAIREIQQQIDAVQEATTVLKAQTEGAHRSVEEFVRGPLHSTNANPNRRGALDLLGGLSFVTPAWA